MNRYKDFVLAKEDIVWEHDGSYWTNHGDPGYTLEAERFSNIVFEAFQVIEGLFKGPKIQKWLDVTKDRYFTYISMHDDGTVVVLQEWSHALCDNCAVGNCHSINDGTVPVRELVLPIKIGFELKVTIEE